MWFACHSGWHTRIRLKTKCLHYSNAAGRNIILLRRFVREKVSFQVGPNVIVLQISLGVHVIQSVSCNRRLYLCLGFHSATVESLSRVKGSLEINLGRQIACLHWRRHEWMLINESISWCRLRSVTQII